MAQTGRFARADRLLRSRDFRDVGQRGERAVSRHFVVLVAVRPVGSIPEGERRRLGVTVSRKVGNAVVRNRIKRGVREWFRRERVSLPGGIDLVVIARSAAPGLQGRELGRALSRQLDRWRVDQA